MKSDPLTGTLIGVLAASALASIFLFYAQVNKSRQARNLQPQLMQIQNKANIFNSLVGEVFQYSQHNPGINATLQGSPIWRNIMASQTNRPATATK